MTTASTSKLQSAPVTPSNNTESINLQSWSITTTKLPILNSVESDSATASLHLPLPEICFGNNKLKLENKNLNLCFEWNCLDALKVVKEETNDKVAYAAEWARGQAASASADVSVQKPFDWTYTTLHPGSQITTSSTTSTPSRSSTSLPLSFQLAPPSHPGIPLHLLARQDIPILFFDEVPLFEDELGDNGIAELVVRVRVNETSFFVLQRFFLRIDHVLFRIFDVRLFHTFGSKEIIRELKGRQADYDEVKKQLPKTNPNDLTPLTDINWVSSVLESLATNAAKVPATWPSPSNSTSTTIAAESLSLNPLSMNDKVEAKKWEGEGRVLEIMYLD